MRPERFTGYEQALRWFTAEYPVLQGVLRSAAAHGLDVHATQLARAMDHYQDRQGRWNDLADAQRTALNSALRTGDRVAMAFAGQGLARAHALFGRFDEAHRRLDEAYEHLNDENDGILLASHHSRRASVLNRQGDHRSALQHIERALALCQESGYSRGEAGAYTSLGWLCAQLEDFTSAIEHCERAVEMHTELDNLMGLANTYDSLGLIYHRVGDYQAATESYLRALDLQHSLGDMNDQMDTLVRLSETYQAIGQLDKARDALERALSIMVDLDLPGAAGLRIKLLGLGGFHAPGQQTVDPPR